MLRSTYRACRTTAAVLTVSVLILIKFSQVRGEEPALREVSGIYPQLAFFNDENECGVGAVVPWAERLWVITYAPHKPQGSTDKLYEITPELRQIIRPESIGGTPANRMIHRESEQLFIGPYVIDARRNVRVIPPDRMFGRLTGTARHLFDPQGKVYVATMEEGIYEIDVQTLEAKELWADEQRKTGRHADLPGYHGKGLYSGQGRLVYANNGEHGPDALRFPHIASGVLAEWDGTADHWSIVRRNQFTEVTGPGGIHGNSDPIQDPVWSVGWDHRSLLLELLDRGNWQIYRLPKSSHSYDGAHGWNTEWPRIRDIGEDNLLMTMHGAFWKFPRSFSAEHSTGIEPRSNYLKVVGDFCRWSDQIVLGCDDAARSEFLNKRKLKGKVAGSGQSQSNLQFLPSEDLDHLGPVIGRGAVWLNEDVAARTFSDPFLFQGYELRTLSLTHQGNDPIEVTLEVDRRGNGKWERLKSITLGPKASEWMAFSSDEVGAWVRLSTDRNTRGLTAFFQYRNEDHRPETADPIFAGLATEKTEQGSGGLLHVRGANFRTLRFIARGAKDDIGCYDLDANLKLNRSDDRVGADWVRQNCAIPTDVIDVDAASVMYVDDQGKRWRLPRGIAAVEATELFGPERICREVCTERDLLNIQGTFFELPAENAGGFAKVRPVATHQRRITDFVSYRGLLVMSGVDQAKSTNDPHLVVSDDGKCALWVGSVDDLWKFGKPRGTGGPWKESPVQSGLPSDPYLMTGYDRKQVHCSHSSATPVRMTIEADFTGQGDWSPFVELNVPPGKGTDYKFPKEFSCYWIRVVADQSTTATATFVYE